MIKKVLVIAPHPDDEINLAGQMIVKLNKLGIEIFVAYTTNGDAEKKIGNKRICEAIKANYVLGINEDHVIFLGYPNEWQGGMHIYNAIDNEELVSKLGKTETNSIPIHPEFCYKQQGIHHKFTRNNFKSDLKDLIKYVNPDMIIAPEFDSHPDHRAASLLFDEVMGELLKDNREFRPIILKKYIHEGVWYGPKDYYNQTPFPTSYSGPKMYSGGIHDLDSPYFEWNERISYATDDDTTTLLLKDNLVFKASKAHRNTTAWYEMQRVINADMIYWNRPTQNLALYANVTSSYGDVKYINDFKYFDIINIIEEDIGNEENSGYYCWIPDPFDYKKEVNFNFDENVKISNIRIYEDYKYRNHIKKIQIKINDNVIKEIELQNSGKKTEIYFENGLRTSNITFKVIEWIGQPAISEIEIYSEKPSVKLSSVPISLFEQTIINKSVSIKQRIEKFFLMLIFLIKFKLK